MIKIMNHLISYALLGLATTSSWAADIVVGGKGFTEQLIMASVTAQYLSHQGLDVERKDGMGSALLRKAQVSGQVDIYWEYTGTSLITYNKVSKKLSSDEVYHEVKRLDERLGLIWLAPSKANNTYALAMRAADAKNRKISSISDLAETINKGVDLKLASDTEFYARPDGLRPLLKNYGFKLKRSHIVRMDAGLAYQALKNNEVDISLVFATDGRIPAFDFIVLKDEKNFFPVYEMAPVVRADVLKKYPDLDVWMNELSSRINDEVMSTLNSRVDVEKVSVEKVAKDFLQAQGLI